jgi:hypothetical protein
MSRGFAVSGDQALLAHSRSFTDRNTRPASITAVTTHISPGDWKDVHAGRP